MDNRYMAYHPEDCVKDNCNSIRKSTLRERLEIQINRNKEEIKYRQDMIKRDEEALKLLTKNKELEILMNLLQS